jgi:murein DD-endopeptidase MepM/ murein hydrolase activator NlpD
MQPTQVAMVPRKSSATESSAKSSTPGRAKRPTAGKKTSTSIAALSGISVIKGKLSRGQSLSGLLQVRGVSAQLLRTIDRQIRPEFDFRRARPGDSFRLTLDANRELVQFRYRTAPDESIVLSRTENGYRVTREDSPLQPHIIRMQGTVKTSLYKSIRGLGHDPALASSFADIFAWDIDFTRQLKRGDGYTILYEQLFREEDGNEIYVRPGRILAAQFSGAVGEHTAVYFEEFDGIGSYFRPDGDTLEQEYLVAPLKFNRISSDYSSARNHPILKVVRPHHGIDYAARTGTPLWSIANGTVIFKGTNGGFGNLVKIRHANGYVSFYAHLSAFNPKLAVGQKIKQKQVVGYVGQTGLATGPHVCFRVTKYGKYVNPASLNHGKAIQRSVADSQWADFEMVRDHLLLGLRDGSDREFAGNAL